MKKIWKVLLIVLPGFILFSSIIIYYSDLKRENAEKDLVEYSKLCDTTKLINEQPKIGFSGFSEKEIYVLQFEIKRAQSIIFDTIIKNKFNYISTDKSFRETKIPFSNFLKTDTIIITTQNNLKFYVSDFHHSASLHYGMFGPIGEYECSLNDKFNINGSHSNCISKDIAFLESERHNRIKIIGGMDEEIEIISKKSKITLRIANQIFIKNRKNKYWMSQIFCGIHVEKTGNYYVFEEEREDKDGKKDIIKINAENGNYIRYSNYPFN